MGLIARHGLEFDVNENLVPLTIDQPYEQVQTYIHNKDRNIDVVVDIGAYVGGFSCFMAKAGAKRIYAFEPMRENFPRLVQNIVRNNMWGIIIPFPFAVSVDHFSERSIGTSPSSAQNSFIYRSAYGRVNVPTYEFNRIIQDIPVIDYLKIDVEGAEFEMFRSCNDVNFNGVGFIDVEVHELTDKNYFDVPGSEKLLPELQSLLIQKGFSSESVMARDRWIRAVNNNFIASDPLGGRRKFADAY